MINRFSGGKHLNMNIMFKLVVIGSNWSMCLQRCVSRAPNTEDESSLATLYLKWSPWNVFLWQTVTTL